MNMRSSTPPNHSRQTSVTPHSNSFQRNGHLSYTSTSLCTSIPKKTTVVPVNDPIDGIEMQVIGHERKTMEAFNELEHLVPNRLLGRASIVRMSSLIQDQDQDDLFNESSTPT